MFGRKLIVFLIKKGMRIINPKKQKKYMSPYYFLFFIKYEFM